MQQGQPFQVHFDSVLSLTLLLNIFFGIESKNGKGGAKGKGILKPPSKGLASPPSSSSEDKLDDEQRAVLEQLFTMEQACGIVHEEPRQGGGGNSEVAPRRSKQQTFTSQVLTFFFIYSQEQPVLQQPVS